MIVEDASEEVGVGGGAHMLSCCSSLALPLLFITHTMSSTMLCEEMAPEL